MRHAKGLVPCLVLVLAAIAATPPAYAQDVLTGAVRSASGQAVPSVWVVLTQGATEQGRSLTGDDGKYYIGSLKSGDYVVQVKRGDAALYRRGPRARLRQLSPSRRSLHQAVADLSTEKTRNPTMSCCGDAGRRLPRPCRPST